MSRRVGGRATMTAILLSVLVGCGSSADGPDATPTTEQPTTCTTAAPPTTESSTASSVALTGRSVVLAPDGLGPAKFGQPADTVVSLLTEVLGEPGRPWTMSGVTWGTEGGTQITAFFSTPGADGVSSFTGWQLRGQGALGDLELATPAGVTLGSSVADALAAYPDALIAADFVTHCGDGWWLPTQYEFDDGVRGIAGPRDTVMDMALAALAAHGYPIDWEHCGDAGCWAVVADYQRSVGLPDNGLFDRATWLSLGLPLPADPTAVITLLEAGTGIVWC